MEDSQEKDYSFLGNDRFPNLYDALVYEQKFKSEYLERQISEQSLKSEPSIMKKVYLLSFFRRHYHKIMKLKCKARQYLSLFS